MVEENGEVLTGVIKVIRHDGGLVKPWKITTEHIDLEILADFRLTWRGASAQSGVCVAADPRSTHGSHEF